MIRTLTLLLIAIFLTSCKNEGSSDRPIPSTETGTGSDATGDTLQNLIKVENPAPGQFITSPLEITGEARGHWFFEAVATAELLDNNMNTIAETNTTAIGEWMTEDWVPFSGNITFEKPSTENGFLVLHKANASGLEEHAMSDTIPIRFRR